VQHLPINALVYLDPPYFDKGQEKLYTNYYKPEDHARIARLVDTLVNRWVVSYDNVNDIVDLYDHHRHISYGINYSAQVRYLGSEIMFFSEQLQIPEVRDPTKLTAKSHQQFLL
jgi:DNA adenine methylase